MKGLPADVGLCSMLALLPQRALLSFESVNKFVKVDLIYMKKTNVHLSVVMLVTNSESPHGSREGGGGGYSLI